MRDQRTLTNTQAVTPQESFTEVVGSDCCLKFDLLWMISKHSLQNLGTGNSKMLLLKLRNKTVFSTGGSSCKEEWRVTQKVMFVLTCGWVKSVCPLCVIQICDKRFLLQRNLTFIFLNSIIHHSPFYYNICMWWETHAKIWWQLNLSPIVHKPERMVSLKKLPEWPKSQITLFNRPDSRFHSVQKIFSVQWILSSVITSLKLGDGYNVLF